MPDLSQVSKTRGNFWKEITGLMCIRSKAISGYRLLRWLPVLHRVDADILYGSSPSWNPGRPPRTSLLFILGSESSDKSIKLITEALERSECASSATVALALAVAPAVATLPIPTVLAAASGAWGSRRRGGRAFRDLILGPLHDCLVVG